MKLIIHGDVKHVVEGTVNKESLETFKVADFACGLGGIVDPAQEALTVGEAMIVDKAAHLFFPPTKSVFTESVHTPFFVGVNDLPDEEIETREYASLFALYEELLQQYQTGFIVTGQVLFSQLHVTYLKQSPIHDESIIKKKDAYFEYEEHLDKTGKLVGVVLPHDEPRIFYTHPDDKEKGAFHSHSHILIEEGVRHLLPQSSIKESQLLIAPLESSV